jgi:preprotein translocase subunit Sec61beta
MATDKSKIRLPSSSGGIMQYYDEYHSKISLSPWVVVAIVIVVMIGVVIMHLLGPSVFGF